MDSKQLVEALRVRGKDVGDSDGLDELRRVFVEEVRPDIRVRLHPTPRCVYTCVCAWEAEGVRTVQRYTVVACG